MPQTLNPHGALIYVMVIMAAADREISDRELGMIGDAVRTLPAFRGFNPEQLVPIAESCARLLGEEGGLEKVLTRLGGGLPERLRETAYVLACQIVMVDGGALRPEEVRLLELIRQALDIDGLITSAIERSVRARYRHL